MAHKLHCDRCDKVFEYSKYNYNDDGSANKYKLYIAGENDYVISPVNNDICFDCIKKLVTEGTLKNW